MAEKKNSQNLPAQSGDGGHSSRFHLPAGAVSNGDSAVLIVKEHDSDGAVILATARIPLREGNGLTKVGDSYMVDSTGIYAANQFAGVTTVTPEFVAGDGSKLVRNPFLERDEHGYVERVTLRMLAVGLSPLGNLVVTSTTLVLNAKAYFMESLAKKIAKFPQVGCVGRENARPQNWTYQPKKWNGKYMADHGEPQILTAPETLDYFAGPMGIGIWADLMHPEVQSLINQAIQGERFFIRKAETIAERRVLSKHPAINLRKIPVADTENGVARVSVVYRHNPMTKQQLDDLTKRLEQGEELTEFHGRRVDVEEAEVVEDAEVVKEAVADEGPTDDEGAEQGELDGGEVQQ